LKEESKKSKWGWRGGRWRQILLVAKFGFWCFERMFGRRGRRREGVLCVVIVEGGGRRIS
jgi:hypothetical protein